MRYLAQNIKFEKSSNVRKVVFNIAKEYKSARNYKEIWKEIIMKCLKCLILCASIALLLGGCAHKLEVKNLNDYQVHSLPTKTKGVSIGVIQTSDRAKLQKVLKLIWLLRLLSMKDIKGLELTSLSISPAFWSGLPLGMATYTSHPMTWLLI